MLNNPSRWTLASGSYDNTIRLWDTKTGQSTKVLNSHHGAVYSLAVLRDGSLAGGVDYIIRLWDTKTGQSTKDLNEHQMPVTALTVLQDGTG